ncbi:hypothetical protein PF005_g14765 [Phytophthora fragariae]|uniref:RxLR effector protein n=1 Tax=Phytophthora fragariae TaxID=53985 RepID=A0A6A3XH75_9STRA|nr:hypothetical protein PF003_g16069 [Phytophthora fragariae]KAE8932964.1 hypothetical protein PF009_g17019 [Phytophthora fragariae]KAE8975199.1 hypothetical protein PF011_g24570 [Phytophthora fragariae]KAE9106869.1 hypothetical protein PF010_g12477 [Phytophthora fragariae]KAE9126437.1 hypothetical protein PF006_g16729 [Phytophthora fragariae]
MSVTGSGATTGLTGILKLLQVVAAGALAQSLSKSRSRALASQPLALTSASEAS